MLHDLLCEEIIADFEVTVAEALVDQPTNDGFGSQWPIVTTV